MNDVRLTEDVPVDTDAPATEGLHGGVVVIVWLNAKLVLVTGAATVNEPRYFDSRVPGVPLIVMVWPALNGLVVAVVTVTVSVGVGDAPVHDAVCVMPPAGIATDTDGSAESCFRLPETLARY